MKEDSILYIGVINQMNMVASRFLTTGKQEEAKNIVNETRKYFEKNRKKHHIDTVHEAVEILVLNYGEFQSKMPLSSDFGGFITEHLKYYLDERSKITKSKKGMLPI